MHKLPPLPFLTYSDHFDTHFLLHGSFKVYSLESTWFREKAATVESGDVVNFFFSRPRRKEW